MSYYYRPEQLTFSFVAESPTLPSISERFAPRIRVGLVQCDSGPEKRPLINQAEDVYALFKNEAPTCVNSG